MPACLQSASGDGDEDEESDEDEEEGGGPGGETTAIDDATETNLVNLRRTIYLTIMSSMDFEESGHKLMKISLLPGVCVVAPVWA